jgi:hypothetical protein
MINDMNEMIRAGNDADRNECLEILFTDTFTYLARLEDAAVEVLSVMCPIIVLNHHLQC